MTLRGGPAGSKNRFNVRIAVGSLSLWHTLLFSLRHAHLLPATSEECLRSSSPTSSTPPEIVAGQSCRRKNLYKNRKTRFIADIPHSVSFPATLPHPTGSWPTPLSLFDPSTSKSQVLIYGAIDYFFLNYVLRLFKKLPARAARGGGGQNANKRKKTGEIKFKVVAGKNAYRKSLQSVIVRRIYGLGKFCAIVPTAKQNGNHSPSLRPLSAN